MIDDPDLPAVGVIRVAPNRAVWRVWAPNARSVALLLHSGPASRRIPMSSLPRGYFEVEADFTDVGQRYSYELDGEEPRPDPLSRSQPEGVRAPSAVLFPDEFGADDDAWKGVARRSLVVYELHVSTFTREGTFAAVVPRLDSLRELGITCIELMPVAQFPGQRSWGYDGVFPFAPQNTYGGPEELRELVSECHKRGLAIFLDVIYNHFGPEGNVFPRFGPYLSENTRSDWGPAANFDGPGCDPVRAMVLDNVRMWIRDYGVDGLRLDAADQIYDRSPRSILAEIAEVAHREADRRGFPAHIFAETDTNDAARFLDPVATGGFGLDGQWNDDFHHAAHVVITGETDGYYSDFADGPRALAKAFQRVFVNDGCYSGFRDRRHGAPACGYSGDRFLVFTQNHDQVGNRMLSDRYAASVNPAAARLANGLLLLAPRIPLFFMGQEYGETNPFPFFCDYEDANLRRVVQDGRKAEFAHFGWNTEPTDPLAASTRDSAVLSWDWTDPVRQAMRRLCAELIALRKTIPALGDFEHTRATLRDSETVLEVIRGCEDGPSATVFFNLTDQSRVMPKVAPNQVARFRSEASTTEAALMPREFIVFH